MELPNSGEGFCKECIKVILFFNFLYILCIYFIFMLIKGGEGEGDLMKCLIVGLEGMEVFQLDY